MTNSIHLFLINGFLGSGKTTLLLNLLQNQSGKRIGVIENEIGEIGIDGKVLRSKTSHIAECDFDLIEINNGSIFCSCKQDAFIDALIELTNYPLDLLIVESSGISDPFSIGSILKIINDRVDRPYSFRGNICVVDAENILDALDVLEVLRRQIDSSRLILINKTDLVSPAVLEEVHAAVRLINSSGTIIDTCFGDISFSLVQQFLDTETEQPGESINTPQNRPRTMVLTTDHIFTKFELLNFLNEFAKETYRIKGPCRTDEGWVILDGVRDRISINPWDQPNEKKTNSELVVILAGENPLGDLIFNIWNKTFN